MSSAQQWRLVCAFCLGLLWLSGCSSPGDTDSPDLGERLEAIRRLADEADDEAVERLAGAARHEDTRTACEAVWALGRAPRQSAVRALERVVSVKSESRPRVRQTAVMALGRRKEPRAREVLLEVARTDPEGAVRAEAAAAVGKVGTLDDVPFLTDLAAADPSVAVQSRAVGAVEALTGYRFPYDSRASERERREALERLKEDARQIAEFQKRFEQREAGR